MVMKLGITLRKVPTRSAHTTSIRVFPYHPELVR